MAGAPNHTDRARVCWWGYNLVDYVALREAENDMRRTAKRTEEQHGTARAKRDASDPNENEKSVGTQDHAMPELTDELAQQLGDFKTANEFRAKLKASLVQEKERAAHDAKRDEIIRAIIASTKITVPPLLVGQEYERFTGDRARELERTGTTLEKYLVEMKKSAKDLETEDHAAIERELKTSLIFQAIRDKEGIKADEREIAANVAFLKRRYPNQDATSFRRTAEAYIIQEKIFKIFEPESAK
jgi:trigger factor